MPNLQRWVTVHEDGKPKQVPIPYDCACGQPANYGLNEQWYCTFCWQTLNQRNHP